jgi:outer membrane protein assembly factor BamC
MRMRDLLRAGAWIATGALLAACSAIELPSKKIDYKSTNKLPPLEIPPDLTRPSSDERFVVPDINPKGTATFSAYSREREGKPVVSSGSGNVLPNLEDARIERTGSQRWLVVKGEPDKIWPVVRDFWQETGFVVNLEIPEAGVMETDWAENRAKVPDGLIRGFFGKLLDSVYSTSERDKFRTRLERGAQPGTTEIYISHRGMEEVFVSADRDQTKWQPRKPDPELEAEMLRRLMVRFGAQQEYARAQVAKAAEPPRATLSRGQDGTGRLALNEQFDRAWRRVGLALDRVGFTVEDRDRSKGLYFVRYIDPQIDNATAKPQGGFLSRLKFWGDSDPKAKAEQYRILVRDSDSGAEVNVLGRDGSSVQSATANRILTLLYDQLK